MAYHEKDGKTFVDGKLTADELKALPDDGEGVEVYVENLDNHCISSYLDDPLTGIQENLTDEAYLLLEEGEPDVWAEGNNIVAFRLFLIP